ncbi:hypothetical protein IHV09_14290 [Fictibacillus sp. 23RED33]|jgi:hypothetical protein|nr:hypothetical protein [Fictibacillus sp. 23RED33]MBH0174734.1 hypothetical protein [Fictibacillus sp. 23RED33]
MKRVVYEKLPLKKLIELIRSGNDETAKAEWKRRWEDDYPRIKEAACRR